METHELELVLMEIQAYKEQMNQYLDAICARIERHLPYDRDARIKRLENYDWSKWDPYDFVKPNKRTQKK